ncbi:hypothetical protein Tco_0229699, partial [Tanacetum coccineum]
MNLEEIQEITKSRITPNPRRQPPGQSREGGIEVGGKEQSASARSDNRHQSSQANGTEVQPMKHHHRGTSPRGNSRYSESEDNKGGHWKSKSKRHKTRMPSHVKTYDGSGDLEDHLKLFQSAAKTE